MQKPSPAKIDADPRVSLRIDDRRTGRVTVLPFGSEHERDTWLAAAKSSAKGVLSYDAEGATLTIHPAPNHTLR